MKNLCKLVDKKSEVLCQIPDSVYAMTASFKDVFLSSPDEGIIYKYSNGELLKWCSNIPGVHGIDGTADLIFCESADLHFFHLRIFDRMFTNLTGNIGRQAIGSIKSDRTIPHPRINGLHCHLKSGTIFFAVPERHAVFSLWRDGGIIVAAGEDLKEGFSIGTNGSGLLSHPSDIETDRDVMFISDAGNHVIREFFIDKKCYGRMLGQPMEDGLVDGVSFNAKLKNPTDLHSHNNILYFIDDYKYIRASIIKSFTVNTLYQDPFRIEALTTDFDGNVYFIQSRPDVESRIPS